MKYSNSIIEIIKALDAFNVEHLEVFYNTIYIQFDTSNLAEDVYYHLIYNHEDLFEDLDYDASRNDVKIRIILY